MKRLTLTLCTVLLAGILLLSLPLDAAAGSLDTWQVQETPLPLPDDIPGNQVTFSDLGLTADLFLQGPLASETLHFSLPPEWDLSSGAALQLEFSVYLSNLIVAQEVPDLEGIIAGRLEAIFNGVALDVSVLQGSGERVLQLAIPDEALVPVSLDGQHELTILWDASASCDLNLATSIALHSSSHLVLPHNTVALEPMLESFPRPLYMENNPFPADVTLVLPDNAGQQELQAFLAVAASLGRLSDGEITPQVVLAGDLNASIYTESHIILVGMQESFSLLQDLTPAQAASTDDGILQMFNSPWNSERALLWVGGGSEAAVLKAAAALGNGTILTSQDPAVAFVSQMPESPALIFDQDQTFADLGQSELTFKDIGSSQAQVEFYIPSGTSIGADAYLDLVLNHSQLMDYSRSGIVVRLNHVPVGSVRLSDTTASLNSVRLIVPASALRTGANLLEVQVDLIARNICTDPRQGSLWVTIFPDSLLHLPVSLQPIVSAASPSLAGFPAPFTSRDLDQTTFVLSPSDPAGWTAAARLAFQMGVESSGSLRMPAVLLADASSAPIFADSSLIVVGLIPQMSFLSSLSTSLPAPLDASGALSDATHAAIGFEITPGTSMGYLEMAASAVSTDTAFLAVLGSDTQGLNGAVDALLSAAMRRKMEGSNFALVQGSTVSAHRLSSESQVEQPVIPGTTVVPQGTGTPAAAEGQGVLPPRQDRWALPAMALSGILIILLVVLEAMSVVKKKKK